MDIVYSLGVLHHTDNAVRCISEAYRVLKPGGIFKVALYHFWSLPHLWLLLSGIRNGNLTRLGYRRLLSTVESGADGVSIAPLVKLYSSRVVRTILSDFTKVEISIRGINYDGIPVIGRIKSPSICKALERRWGWYVVAVA